MMFAGRFKKVKRFTLARKPSSRLRRVTSASRQKCLQRLDAVSSYEFRVSILETIPETRTRNSKLESMFLGKVIGTVWSTKKTPDLEGVRLDRKSVV